MYKCRASERRGRRGNGVYVLDASPCHIFDCIVKKNISSIYSLIWKNITHRHQNPRFVRERARVGLSVFLMNAVLLCCCKHQCVFLHLYRFSHSSIPLNSYHIVVSIIAHKIYYNTNAFASLSHSLVLHTVGGETRPTKKKQHLPKYQCERHTKKKKFRQFNNTEHYCCCCCCFYLSYDSYTNTCTRTLKKAERSSSRSCRVYSLRT